MLVSQEAGSLLLSLYLEVGFDTNGQVHDTKQNSYHNHHWSLGCSQLHSHSKSVLPTASREYNGVTFISLLQQSLTKFLECYTLIEDVTEMQVSNPSAQPQSLFLRGTQEWQF